jgi:hypothetical protein
MSFEDSMALETNMSFEGIALKESMSFEDIAFE